MNEQLPSDAMLKRLRILAKATRNPFLTDVADRLEQLQMPHAEVIEIAEAFEEGADSAALIKALCKKVESQRKQIARLQEKQA